MNKKVLLIGVLLACVDSAVFAAAGRAHQERLAQAQALEAENTYSSLFDAERIYRELGDRVGQARCARELERLNTYSSLFKAEKIYRELGDRVGQARCAR
ncbi:hypothetical protein EBR77_02555, partial [bacterium]|nr:hypothetical protein [bacterium]